MALFFFLAALGAAAGQLPDAYQQGVVRPYRSYADVALFHYHVPAATSRARWEFAAFMDDPGCRVRDVHIYLQHGSYPVINPENASLPAELYRARTALRRLTVASGPRPHQPTRLPVAAPLDGEWYAVAYIPPWDQAVAQQGITHKCTYSLGSIGYWHQERPQLLETNRPLTIRTIARLSYFKFYVPSDTESLSVAVSGCRVVEDAAPPEDDVHPCVSWVALRPRALPSRRPAQEESSSPDRTWAAQRSVEGVRSGGSYHLEPDQLWHDAYYHLAVVAESSAALNVTVTLKHCEFVPDEGRTPAADVTVSQLTNVSRDLVLPPRCQPVTELTRVKYAQDFTDTFLAVNAAFYYTWVELTDRHLSSVRFETREFVDVGGTLYVDLQLSRLLLNASSQLVTVDGCLSAHVLPVTAGGRLRCEPALAFRLSSAAEASMRAVRLLPFPEPAVWYISLRTRCRAPSSGAVLPCIRSKYLVNLDVHTQPCVWPDAPCGRHGVCRENHRGQHFFTSCSCRDGYRGWDCGDGSAAVSGPRRALAVCLLTLSNLCLVPAIALSWRRRLFTLALVYAAAMLFSMLYHVCDQLGQQLPGSSYCLLRFEVLQFCDFFSSILSCWVTLISLGGVAEPVLHMLGALGVAVAVRLQPTALWVFLAPFLLAAAVPVGVYAVRCYRRGRLECPSPSWLFRHLLPGIALALLGLVLFTWLETDGNYQYTHSLWHASLAFALFLLLPGGPARARRASDQRHLVLDEALQQRQLALDELPPAASSPTFSRPGPAA